MPDLTDRLAEALRASRETLRETMANLAGDRTGPRVDAAMGLNAIDEVLARYDQYKRKCQDEPDSIVADPEGDIPTKDYLLAHSAYLRYEDVVLHLQIEGVNKGTLKVEALPNSDVMSTPYWTQRLEIG